MINRVINSLEYFQSVFVQRVPWLNLILDLEPPTYCLKPRRTPASNHNACLSLDICPLS